MVPQLMVVASMAILSDQGMYAAIDYRRNKRAYWLRWKLNKKLLRPQSVSVRFRLKNRLLARWLTLDGGKPRATARSQRKTPYQTSSMRQPSPMRSCSRPWLNAPELLANATMKRRCCRC